MGMKDGPNLLAETIGMKIGGATTVVMTVEGAEKTVIGAEEGTRLVRSMVIAAGSYCQREGRHLPPRMTRTEGGAQYHEKKGEREIGDEIILLGRRILLVIGTATDATRIDTTIGIADLTMTAITTKSVIAVALGESHHHTGPMTISVIEPLCLPLKRLSMGLLLMDMDLLVVTCGHPLNQVAIVDITLQMEMDQCAWDLIVVLVVVEADG